MEQLVCFSYLSKAFGHYNIFAFQLTPRSRPNLVHTPFNARASPQTDIKMRPLPPSRQSRTLHACYLAASPAPFANISKCYLWTRSSQRMCFSLNFFSFGSGLDVRSSRSASHPPLVDSGADKGVPQGSALSLMLFILRVPTKG